jgi:crossover junction endodeoxyribonuclease RusA
MTLRSAVEQTRHTILSNECTSNVIKIELPLPPPELFPNRAAGKHWAVLYKHKKAFKETCYLLTKSQVSGKFTGGLMMMTLMYCFPNAINRDVDNCLAASKSGLDGMAEAIGINDKYLDPILVYRTYNTEPKLIIQLEVL